MSETTLPGPSVPAIVVAMVGGPFDGQLIAVPGTDNGAPREPVLDTMHCIANLSARLEDAEENVHLGVRRGRYELHITSGEDGPLWQYRFRGSIAY